MGDKKGLLKSILPWLIVLAALSVAIPFFNQSESSEIRYDKFIKIVQDEKVKEVEIDGEKRCYPEYESAKKLALKHQCSLQEIYHLVK